MILNIDSPASEEEVSQMMDILSKLICRYKMVDISRLSHFKNAILVHVHVCELLKHRKNVSAFKN